MPQAVPIVLGCWVFLTLLLFGKLPPKRAAAVCLLGGWLFLPSARYPDEVSRSEFPFWILPASLPSPPWITKATVIGVSALLGVLAFDPRAFLRLRLSWIDPVVIAWCAWPLVSSLANGLGLLLTATITASQCLAWGVPYLMGRLYFSDTIGRDELARSLVLGGLIYAPFCLVEGVIGPWIYATLYGFHPYQADGARRYVGYRPIVLLEHGNQLGIWLAVSAITAVTLWRSGQLRRVGPIHGVWVAGGLVAITIASQSAGAILLMVLGLAAMAVARRSGRIWPLMLPLALVGVGLGLRALNLVDAKALAQKTATGRAAIFLLDRTDRHSLGWRMRVEERQAKLALQRPITGWGRWDWWKSGEERPWGLPGLVLGMYGLPGWALLIACVALPVGRFCVLVPPRSWKEPGNAEAAALAAALTVGGLDAILNAAFLLPLMASAGSLASFSAASKRSDPSSGHLVVKLGRS